MQETDFSTAMGEQGRQASEALSGGGSFDASSGDSSLERRVLSVADAVLQGEVAEGVVVLPLPEMPFAHRGLRFVREGNDLILKAETGGGVQVVVEGYFAAFPPPILTMESGSQLSPAQVVSLLEQGGNFVEKHAAGAEWIAKEAGAKEAESKEEMQAIGEIVSAEGLVQMVRDGMVMRLKAGDMIWKGDIVSTGEGAEVFMRFTDKTELRLGEDARLTIDQYSYDEVSSSDLQVLSISEGAFSYASGLIAGASSTSARLQTPQGAIGIQGATILGDVGDNYLYVTLLQGGIALSQDEQEIVALEVVSQDERFEVLRVVSRDGVSKVTTGIISIEEMLETYSFLDGSEPQLQKSLTEAKLLPGNNEQIYITAPVAEEEVSAPPASKKEEKEENTEADEVEREDEPLVAPQSVFVSSDTPLAASELSFAGSSIAVNLDIADIGTVAFRDVAGLVFRQGANVEVVRQESGDFIVAGVSDLTGGGRRRHFRG